VIGLACGDGQTLAVTTTGEVWAWGCYKDKEGKKWFNPLSNAPNPLKDIKKQQNSPMKIAGLKHIVELACGASFSLAKTSDGVMYSWGIGECGELGRKVSALKVAMPDGEQDYDLPSILRDHLTPAHMHFDTTGAGSSNPSIVGEVKSFGCGAYHSLVAIVGDRLFACGLNNYGQLGLGNTTSKELVSEVKALCGVGIASLKGGMHHSLVLSSAGGLFAFGRSDSGQLGSNQGSIDAAGDFSALPIKPLLPSHVVVTGIDCGGNHNLALTKQGEVYSWGYGDMLALGHGEEKDEFLPKKLNFNKANIKNITVTQVAGGGQHSAIIGRVVST
jgi:regulator of chromosome condensation